MLLFLAAHSAAQACSLVGPETLAVDPQIDDAVAPTPPDVTRVEVQRGHGPRAVNGGQPVSSSCDDIGFIHVIAERPAGDPDGDDTVGYRMVLVSGTLPDKLELPSEPWLGPALSLHWIDGATDVQEAFDATVELIPVDQAGNEGEAVEVVLSDPGQDEPTVPARCQTGLGPAGVGMAAAISALCLLARRRRR